MTISVKEMVFAVLGGLGLFLFGINFMSNALQEVAGDRLRRILERGTKTPVRGVLVGALVTAMIQSSSATTVLTVGLVNAQLLTLRQAIGVIFGANIGTTMTAFLIGFNLQEYALPIVAVGAVLMLFAKADRPKLIGQALFGFGTLFFGLTLMGSGMKPLKDLPLFIDMMTSIDNNPVVGVLIGVLMTALVQSSSATIGVLQQLAYQGAITYNQAVPIVFGDNIGTTVTALLASLGTSINARRTALTHMLFNTIGTVIFLPLFIIGVFTPMVEFFTNHVFALLPGVGGTWEMINVKLQIANTHAVFNISNTIIHLPFVGALAWLVTRLVPDVRKEAEMAEMTLQFIDRRFASNPTVALALANKETVRMGKLAREALINAVDYFYTHDRALVRRGMGLEEVIDMLEREITDYLVLASERRLSHEESNEAYGLLQSLSEIERIADLAQNIIREADYATKHAVQFSGEAQEELRHMIELTKETVDLTVQVLAARDRNAARRVEQNERLLDDMQNEFRRNHIRRLNEHICNGNNGAVFLDLLGNLERIGDHCLNIVQFVMGEA